jgi:hypothetical protein
MSISLRRWLNRFVLALGTVCLLAVPASTMAATYEDYLVRSLQLLRDLLPSLRGAQVLITCNSELSDRDPLAGMSEIQISLYRSYPQVRSPREDLLGADVRFNPHTDLLRSVWIAGPFVSDRVDRLRKEAETHPEWTDAQVVAALKGAGARYGPDNRAEFLRIVPLKALETEAGRLELVSAEFLVRYGWADPWESQLNNIALVWRVEAKGSDSLKGHQTKCTMWFDPFGGRVTRLDIDVPE